MYMPTTLWTRSFFLVALVQAVIVLALEAYVFGVFEANVHTLSSSVPPDTLSDVTKTIPTYLAIFIFGFLYQLWLVWDALRLKNTIQVIGVCLYNLGFIIYSAVEIEQLDEGFAQLGKHFSQDTSHHLHDCLIAAPCVISAVTLMLSFIAWKLYDEFAWTIYKHISADLRLKKRFLIYQIYIALLKFDFFFFLGFAIQFVVIVHGSSLAEFIITIVAIPVMIILLLLAALFVRRENYAGQIFTIMLYFAAMAYFIFKLVRMYDAPQDVRMRYKPARHDLTTFAILTLLLLVVTIVTAFMVMKNFKKGLRPHIQKRKVPNADDAKYSNYASDNYDGGQNHQLGGMSHRMTID